jgi:histidinol dehydrogenase
VDLREVTGEYAAWLPRAEFDPDAASKVVKPIVEDVRHRGAVAIAEYSQKFDGVVPEQLQVPAEQLEAALKSVSSDLKAALGESIRRLRLTSAAELETDVVTQVAPDAQVIHRKVPIDRVGLYVPGGVAPLVSSVVMNVVPAQVAGVPSIAVASPPQAEFGGLPHPNILAAAALLGVTEVYAVGGAQAIAMFAYGAGPCRPVKLITGPGNIYTVTAKRLVKGTVGIDSEAGPTEIAILADDSADPAFVAADLISQAEHDELAGAVLVTASEELADRVEHELDLQIANARHETRIKAALSGEQSAIVLTADLQQSIEIVNAYAAEHLEVLTEDAEQVARQITNAGAIFVGPYSPVSLGDYCAGSNHVLPTGGCACHSSGLSVRAFVRSMHVVNYSQHALSVVADHIVTLAEAEDLPSHGAAITARVHHQ